MIRKLVLLVVVLVFAALPNAASAYWPYWGYGGFGPWGNGWGYNLATNSIPTPPYFSVYPPVYYSHQITARHYGASPFAWTPGMEPITYTGDPAAMAAPEPQIIENPFVTAKNTNKQVSAVEKVVEPLKMDNPFAVSVAR
jgi:hypothetical protein